MQREVQLHRGTVSRTDTTGVRISPLRGERLLSISAGHRCGRFSWPSCPLPTHLHWCHLADFRAVPRSHVNPSRQLNSEQPPLRAEPLPPAPSPPEMLTKVASPCRTFCPNALQHLGSSTAKMLRLLFLPPWGGGAWAHLCLASGGDKPLLPLGLTSSPSTRSDGVMVFPVQPCPGRLAEVGTIWTTRRRPTQLLLLEASHPTGNLILAATVSSRDGTVQPGSELLRDDPSIVLLLW